MYLISTSMPSLINSNALPCDLESDTAHIGKWFKQIGTLILETRGSMISGTSRSLRCVPDIDTNIRHSVLPNLLQYDNMGVTVTSTLPWDLHMHKICSEPSQKVGLLGRLRSSVPKWDVENCLANMCTANNRLLYYCLGLCTNYTHQ